MNNLGMHDCGRGLRWRACHRTRLYSLTFSSAWVEKKRRRHIVRLPPHLHTRLLLAKPFFHRLRDCVCGCFNGQYTASSPPSSDPIYAILMNTLHHATLDNNALLATTDSSCFPETCYPYRLSLGIHTHTPNHFHKHTKGVHIFMLGEGIFLTCVAVPVCCGAFFVASRRRLSLQWRDELLDLDSKLYEKQSDSDLHNTYRKVQPASSIGSGFEVLPLARHEDIGMCHRQLFSHDEVDTMLDAMRTWSEQYGQRRSEDFVKHQERLCLDAVENAPAYIDEQLPPAAQAASRRLLDEVRKRIPLFSETRVVADHAVDCHVMKAPWGCGDRIAFDKMPSALRHCVASVQDTFPGIGRLRHVYMEYAPNGGLMHPPSCPKAFDGHDYVIIPLTRKRQGEGDAKPSSNRSDTPLHGVDAATVITMTPLMRSRQSIPSETLFNSWTSRDIDALVPRGSALRVFGPARYFWCWSLRPSQWFGSCADAPLLPASRATASEHDASRVVAVAKRLLAKFPWSAPRPATKTADSATHETPASSDEAVIVLHFEGPRSAGKVRNRFFHPESLVFGFQPKPQTFERWVEERPTEDDVWSDFIVVWMIKHYFDMLTTY